MSQTFEVSQIEPNQYITLYDAKVEGNRVFKRPTDAENVSGTVVSIVEDVIRIRIQDTYVIDGAIHGRSWHTIIISKAEMQGYIDQGLCYLHIHERSPRTWT